jgi:hypothetical protein
MSGATQRGLGRLALDFVAGGVNADFLRMRDLGTSDSPGGDARRTA